MKSPNSREKIISIEIQQLVFSKSKFAFFPPFFSYIPPKKIERKKKN